MKQFISKSVSLRYDPAQDRLQWISHCAEKQMVSVWFARRVLLLVMPQLAEWLEKTGGVSADALSGDRVAETEKKRYQQFEHEAAQQQVPIVQDVLPRERIFEAEFLVNSVKLAITRSQKVKLILLDDKNSVEVISVMSVPEIHKIIGELLRLSDAANWQVPNPWRQALALHEESQKTMH